MSPMTTMWQLSNVTGIQKSKMATSEQQVHLSASLQRNFNSLFDFRLDYTAFWRVGPLMNHWTSKMQSYREKFYFSIIYEAS